VPSISRRTALYAAAGLAMAAGAAAAALAVTVWSGSSGPKAHPAAPNIVLILTDDQRWDTLQAMPAVQQLLVLRGVTFSNAFVVNSLCCPSRASILTGGYSHTTGVYANGGKDGGFEVFDDSSTIATRLQDKGYETGFFGKYLNRYGGAYVPPGWDRWFAFSGVTRRPRPSAYVDFTVNDGGKLVPYKGASNYSTDLLASVATEFIRDGDQPLFLFFSTAAPHEPSPPPPRYARSFSDLPAWRPKSYNEADVSDKPSWLRAVPRLDPERKAEEDALRRNQYGALLAVDDAVRKIIITLRETGMLQNTLILFMSDNGESWGEHRWTNKLAAYEEDIRIPFVLRWDARVPVAQTDSRLVTNIDVSPTFAAAAGVAPPAADGHSVLPLHPSSWRRDFLVEHLPFGRAQARDGPRPPAYCAVRNTRFAYVAYSTHEEELYDLKHDPFELENVARDARYASFLPELRARLLELCEPPPPGVDFAWLRSR
jgi:arylsulfatase A-like enzyme